MFDLDMLQASFEVVPLLVLGLLARGLATFATMRATLRMRSQGGSSLQANTACLLNDTAFTCIASLPRGSVQACLGSVSVSGRALSIVGGGGSAHLLIVAAAKLYVLVLSLAGTILLHALGPRFLRTPGGPDGLALRRVADSCDTDDTAVRTAQLWSGHEEVPQAESTVGTTLRLGLISEDDVFFEDADTPAFPVREAAQILSKLYHIDKEQLAELVEQALVGSLAPPELDHEDLLRDEDMSPSRQSHIPLTSPIKDPEQAKGRLVARRLTKHANVGLLAQLELDGSVLAENSRAFNKAHSSAVRL